ncbi:MAG: tRNA (adenosine(37)-N6)-dimethylallyltransferase MiaA [Nevskiaceae bacterium]
MQPAVLVMGPTASGKSQLALALCEQLPCEIVSVDSAQVYRGMDVGTAKPDAATRARVPHHLIDLCDPAEAYSAARFCAGATHAVAEVRARGRIPLLVGGTMLYFRALQQGLSDLPAADAGFRAALAQEAARVGWRALHARLASVDPATAARLHPNDGQRVQRALEIHQRSGTPASGHAPPVGGGLDGPVVKLALNPPERRVLHARIAERFHAMMRHGFLDEVARLRARGDLSPDLPSMRAVGYRQLWAHLDGDGDAATAVDRGIAATRQFAKRQLTWLRSERNLEWFDPAAPDFVARAMELIRQAGAGSGC